MTAPCLRTVVVALVALVAEAALAQETVFNVPSGDVLDHGKVYGELDITFRPDTSSIGFAPRIVVGAGHRIEVGLNASGLATHVAEQTTLAPTFKWKAWEGGKNGWALLIGDDVFLPVQNRTYAAGNYVYAEFAHTWQAKTRVTFGAYHFTRDVVAGRQRAGGQFAIEQPIGNRVSLAADWYTGNHSLGYCSPGIVLKLTSKFTFYATYQIGNSGATRGNHQLLVEFGWSPR